MNRLSPSWFFFIIALTGETKRHMSCPSPSLLPIREKSISKRMYRIDCSLAALLRSLIDKEATGAVGIVEGQRRELGHARVVGRRFVFCHLIDLTEKNIQYILTIS